MNDLGSVTIMVSAIIILYLIILTYVYFYLMNLDRKIQFLYFKLSSALLQKIDMIPIWLEIIRKEDQTSDFSDLIEHRSKILNLISVKGELKTPVDQFWTEFDSLDRAYMDNPLFSRNTFLLNVDRRLDEQQKAINNAADKYNHVLEIYNKLRNFILVMPLSLILSSIKFQKY